MLEVGSWMLEAGCWRLDVGSWMLEAGCLRLEAGCWKAGCWKLEVGGWKLDAVFSLIIIVFSLCQFTCELFNFHF
jgi:hypothetical protein